MTSHQAAARNLALISVSDKTGIVDFARRLTALGFTILSTGGSAQRLTENHIEVTEVSKHTGFPEMMNGRVKTLHPRIHAGLLGRAGEDEAVMAEHGIERIALAVINLYPFETVIGQPGCSLQQAIENIDIGGPAMVRSAAKNYAAVAIVTSPDQYAVVLRHLQQGGGSVDLAFRFELAVAAFNHIARYDAAISNYLSALQPASDGVVHGERQPFPAQANGCFEKIMDLRYGENPHQQAAWYRDPGPVTGLAGARQLQGKALSFNNIADADTAWNCAQSFEAPCCAIVKHANPCGVAIAPDSRQAYTQAFATDPTSAFGGVIAFNGAVDAGTAGTIIERQFVELIIAPAFDPAALTLLAQKPNVRVLQATGGDGGSSLDIKRITGGVLLQTADRASIARDDCRVVSQRQPTAEQWADMLFAWKVVKMVKSNAIVYAAAGQTRGIGAGQMSRVDSARIACWKADAAGLELPGCVMASDAFFPFRDAVDTAAAAGIACVIQPGGSLRDAEVVAAADEHAMAMVFTGIRHFRH